MNVSADDIKEAIRTQAPSDCASKLLLERIPFMFTEDWELYRAWRKQLGAHLGVDPCSISIIGSACVGISLNPNKNWSAFAETSDIDVAIISPHHFDIGWRILRSLKMSDARDYKERIAISDHKSKYIYFGCLALDKVYRFMPFWSEWAVAESAMTGAPPTEGRELKYRVYKDFESLRSYHTDGIGRLRNQLLGAAA